MLLEVGREGGDQVWYAYEGCKRHAIAVSCARVVGLCDSRSGRHNVNRWWSGEDCAVSAYSENFAVWGEVRLGRRGVGANTYTAVVVVDSVVWRVASAVPTGEGGGSESRGGAACRAGLRWFVVQLPVTDTG